jgi:hypothetical protein
LPFFYNSLFRWMLISQLNNLHTRVRVRREMGVGESIADKETE